MKPNDWEKCFDALDWYYEEDEEDYGYYEDDYEEREREYWQDQF